MRNPYQPLRDFLLHLHHLEPFALAKLHYLLDAAIIAIVHLYPQLGPPKEGSILCYGPTLLNPIHPGTLEA